MDTEFLVALITGVGFLGTSCIVYLLIRMQAQDLIDNGRKRLVRTERYTVLRKRYRLGLHFTAALGVMGLICPLVGVLLDVKLLATISVALLGALAMTAVTAKRW